MHFSLSQNIMNDALTETLTIHLLSRVCKLEIIPTVNTFIPYAYFVEI
jgi:hypothetical protein